MSTKVYEISGTSANGRSYKNYNTTFSGAVAEASEYAAEGDTINSITLVDAPVGQPVHK